MKIPTKMWILTDAFLITLGLLFFFLPEMWIGAPMGMKTWGVFSIVIGAIWGLALTVSKEM